MTGAAGSARARPAAHARTIPPGPSLHPSVPYTHGAIQEYAGIDRSESIDVELHHGKFAQR